MSSHFKAPATTSVQAIGSRYSYSLKRWSGFDAWQEHVRKSAAAIDNALSVRADRDLRRAIVPG